MVVDASSDKSPKIGPEHQVQDVPDLVDSKECAGDSSVLLWSPATASKISGHAMRSYLTLASSCLVPGGSRNEEAALGSLQVMASIPYVDFKSIN